MITLQKFFENCPVLDEAKVKDCNSPELDYITIFKDLIDFSAISDKERNVWNERNFPQFHNVLLKLGDKHREHIWARFEYPIPGSGNRCDLILTGMKGTKPVLLVVEFKSWEEFNTSKKHTVDAVDNQIKEYIELLKNRHEYCHDDTNITIKGVGVFTEITSVELSRNNVSSTHPHHSIHCEDEGGQDCFIEFLEETFDSSLDDNDTDEATKIKKENMIVNFDSGKFAYKERDIIKMLTQLPELLPKISKILGSTNSINEFSPDYKKIIERILTNIVSQEKSFTIVKGEAGSGKTAMAIYILLLHLYRNLDIENKLASCRLVIKSKVLREVLTENMNKYFGNMLGESLITHDNGFYNEKDTQYELVIIDEAHSLSSIKVHNRDKNNWPQTDYEMEKVLQTIFDKTRHLVCFIDENQSIYPHRINLTDEDLQAKWNKIYFKDGNPTYQAKIYELNERYRLDEKYFNYIKEFYRVFKEEKRVENISLLPEKERDKKEKEVKERIKFTDNPDEVKKFLEDNTKEHNKLTKILVNFRFDTTKYEVKLFGDPITNLKDNENDIEIVNSMSVDNIEDYNNSQYYLNAFSALGFDIDYGVLILTKNQDIEFDNNNIIFTIQNDDKYDQILRYYWVLLTRIKKELLIFIDRNEAITINEKKTPNN